MVKHDDYMTPFSAWEDVSAYIPRHLTLWEAFYGDGTSGAHLAELGQVVAGRAVAVEGFPEGEVARDVGTHVLPRGEGGHVVVVLYHTYYNSKFGGEESGSVSRVCKHGVVVVKLPFRHPSMWLP